MASLLLTTAPGAIAIPASPVSAAGGTPGEAAAVSFIDLLMPGAAGVPTLPDAARQALAAPGTTMPALPAAAAVAPTLLPAALPVADTARPAVLPDAAPGAVLPEAVTTLTIAPNTAPITHAPDAPVTQPPVTEAPVARAAPAPATRAPRADAPADPLAWLADATGIVVPPAPAAEADAETPPAATPPTPVLAAIVPPVLPRAIRTARKDAPATPTDMPVAVTPEAAAATPDDAPRVLTVPEAPGAVVATGFHRHGILLAPWAAGRILELLHARLKEIA